MQFYVSAPQKTVTKPDYELRAFGKTRMLAPGESEIVTVCLTDSDLASFVEEHSAWVTDTGRYEVLIGASSVDIRQKCGFEVKRQSVVPVHNVLR